MPRLWTPEGIVLAQPRSLVRLPGIIRGGRTREAGVEMAGARMAGFVTIELVRRGRVIRRLRFRNLLTDAGLNYFGAGTGNLGATLNAGWFAVGTGSTAPAVTDTTLATEFNAPQTRTQSTGGTSNVTGTGPSFEYSYIRVTRVWTEAQVNGNLTEFGWFSASTGGTLFARQLFKDAGGVPTTITKTASDQLKLTYEFRVYPTQTDRTGTINISGTNYDWTSRPMEIDSNWTPTGNGSWINTFGAWTSGTCFVTGATVLAAVTGNPGGVLTASSSHTLAAYTNGNFYRDHEWVWDPAAGNIAGGMGVFRFFPFTSLSNGDIYQLLFNPLIPKDNTKRFRVTVRFYFGRYP